MRWWADRHYTAIIRMKLFFSTLPRNIIECFKADATRSEILGMIREAFGYSYDTVGMIERPKFLN